MRTPFDRFAKEAWSAILERAARVETESEVAADVQFVDLTYEPDPTKLAALEPFGLVARMVKEGPGLLEFFHSAPSVDDVLFCIQKQIERRRKRRDPAVDPAPRLWILTAGRPAKALDELGFAHDAAWPWGVHRCAPGFLVKLIVVSDLPVTRDTLLLRILGAGPVLKTAIAELAALPADAPERGVVLPIVLRLWGERGSATHSAEDEDFYMSTQAIVQQWERELLEKGAATGALKKTRDVLMRQLRTRFGNLDAAAESRIAKATAEELDRWVERVIVAERIDDVFKE
jgi:hypothetical protein